MSSFSDLIKSISSSTPAELDPEDSYHSIDSKPKPTTSQSQTQYHSVPPSKLRNQFEFELENDSLNKYSGKKVSRKDIQGQDGDDGSDLSHDEDEDEEDEEDDDDEDEEDDEEDDEDEDDEEEADPSNPEPDLLKFKPQLISSKPLKEDETPTRPENNLLVKQLQASVKADLLKGKAIKSQLAVYDSLLGFRIGLQKVLTATNEISQIIAKEGIPEAYSTQTVLNQLISLSSSVGNLRSEMMMKNDLLEVPDRVLKKRKSESEPNLDNCIEETQELDKILSPYLRTTIQKWSTKINSATSLTNSHKKFNSVNQNVLNQLDTLWKMSEEKERLIERTRLKRHKPNPRKKDQIGLVDQSVEEFDQFDDRDFYLSLLKEVVDTNLRETDPTGFPTNRSQRTHHPNVDPKASKGRKIRYHVHEKIVSFMVPVPTDLWTDESKDELFGSLLGRGFESLDGCGNEEEVKEKEVGLGELKLF